MKIEFFKSVIQQTKLRRGFALLLFVCLSFFVFKPGAAQLKEPKHVTAIQLGGAAEGSRVTVVSDAALIDYEAFRRGDRFYVKIPLADLTGATPHFRADGFEDVQVQKVGDSLIVSFKLQPGATARVDQRGNRLDVVFSAANRIPYNNAANLQPAGDRSGPMPSDSATSRVRVVTDRNGSYNESRAPGDPRWQASPRINSNNNSNKAGDNKTTTGNVATTSPSPSSSPSSILSPGSSTTYQPPTTATTPASATSSPATGAANSGGFLNWRNRLAVAGRWMSANRVATLLGALILLSLIAYLVIAMRRRRETVVKTKQAKTPKVQPRYSPGSELNELPKAASNAQPSRQESTAPKPAVAAAAASHSGPNTVSPSVGQDEQEEEREVFEL